jgi:hypothetical protein
MPRIASYLTLSLLFLGLQGSTKAQNIVVPAGTLLHCTLEEPNLSSATASIGDPVVCHLSSLRQFGQNVFPRGSYLGGHLEADKEPGRFVGKGYLRLQFDRIGFSNTDIPVLNKVIAVKGYRVDRQGDIVGRGHATRDTVEWLLPPLWPWKVLTLPARGPRPTLKGEEQITLRLMDDIEVPRVGATAHSYDRLASPDRPSTSYRPQSFDRSQSPNRPLENISGIKYHPPSTPATDTEPLVPVTFELRPQAAESSSQTVRPPVRLKLIALKSDSVYTVTNYRIDEGSLNYVLASGTRGSVDVAEVDWHKTWQLNLGPSGAVTPRTY